MKNREMLVIPKQDAIDILDGKDDDFEIIEDIISGQSRWSIIHKLIIKRKSDSKFFKGGYRVGATESQDESPWECEFYVEFFEVFPVEKTVIVYK